MANNRFGTSLAADGPYAVTGAIQATGTTLVGPGAAYVLAVQPIPDCDGNMEQDECQLIRDPAADSLPPFGVIDACQCDADNDCNDMVTCTSNTCNLTLGVCEFPPAPGFCFIAGTCHSDGATNPANECQVCDSTMSGTAWSNKPDTPTPAACADENPANACTRDICMAGVCTHPAEAAGLACGSMVDHACDDPDTCNGFGMCLNNFAPIFTPCPDNNFCNGMEICSGMGVCVGANPCTAAPNDVCDEANDRCVQCLVSADCTDPNFPFCDTISGHCVECLADTDCPAAKPFCDVVNKVCVQCVVDTACPTDGNACNGSEVCQTGVCASNHVNPCLGNPLGENCRPGVGADQFECVRCVADLGCDDLNDCTMDECDIVPGMCKPPILIAANTPCGDPNDSVCDHPDTCDGQGNCLNHRELDDTDCSDGLFCNGTDVCAGGQCASAGDPCPVHEVCNEELDRCEVITCGANQCFQAQAISGDGLYCFDNTSATTDGPNHAFCPYFPPGAEARDLWYCWQATATGSAQVETCGLTNIDTTLAIYAGCACPTAATPPIRCSDDSCGLQTTVQFDAVKGQSFLIRLSSFPNSPGGSGLLRIATDPICGAGAGECCFAHSTPGCNDEVCCETVCACDPYCCDVAWDRACAGIGFQGNGCGARLLCAGLCPVCVESSFLPDCEVDAGQPHAISAPSPLHGPVQMQLTFDAACPITGLSPDDFSVSVHPGPVPVGFEIMAVSTAGSTAMLDFSQPFPAGHWTCVTHIESGEQVCNGFLPGDSDGDGMCTAVDVQGVAGSISEPPTNQWASFATDLDRSGVTNSFDVIHAADLLNGAGVFDPWLGAMLPPCPSGASVTVLQPGPGEGKDIWTTSVYSYAPGGSFPGGGLDNDELRVGGWGDEYYSLLEFDLTGLPASASSAVLHLYCYAQFGGGTTMYLDRITQAWDWRTQGTGRDFDRLWWADRPMTTQWQANPIPNPTQGQWYAIDITDLYNAWQSGVHPNYGLQLRPVNFFNNNFNNFYSSDYLADPTIRPKLVVHP